MSEADKTEDIGQENLPRTEIFLRAVESKTVDPCHRRLLKACRLPNTAQALDEELSRIIDEILREN